MGGLDLGQVGHAPIRGDYRFGWFPTEPVRGQNTTFGFAQHDVSVRVPIWQQDGDELSGNVGVRAEVIHTGAILPTTGEPFPEELWNVRVGLGYRHQFDNGWSGGLNVHVGSASDHPFESRSVLNLGVSANLRVPWADHSGWIFSLSYSSNSQVLNRIPIPGVAYYYAPDPSLNLLVGFPFANVTWRPTEDWTFQVNYALLTNVRAKVLYRVLPDVRVYLAYDSTSENWYRTEREDDRDRLFSYDQRVTTGVQWRLAPFANLDLCGGYAFDRYFYEASNTGVNLHNRDRNRIDIGDGPFTAVKLELKF
jgi:hypothetical protein